MTALSACDARVREIRSRLGPSELARFDRGRQLAAPCWACHDLYGPIHKIGPSLHGVFGRRIGGAPGFAYSATLGAADGVWTAETLRAFLTDVNGFAPGTTMVSPGVPGPEDARALVYYLELVTKS